MNFGNEIELLLFETCSNFKNSKENPNFPQRFQWFGLFLQRYINWDSYPSFMTNLAIFAWFVKKWQRFNVAVSVNQFFKKIFYEVYLIFIQNHVEAKRLEPVLWNFAWTNGRLYAFWQILPEFPKMYILDAIKVLLVTLDIESRVLYRFFVSKRRKMASPFRLPRRRKKKIVSIKFNCPFKNSLRSCLGVTLSWSSSLASSSVDMKAGLSCEGLMTSESRPGILIW